MYQEQDCLPGGRRLPDLPGPVSPAARARHAAARVRRALAGEAATALFDPALARDALAGPAEDPQLEGERCFALGWLRWLAGEPEAAEPVLARAAELFAAGSPEAVQAAYWLARVRLLCRRADALPAFEQLLRTLQGSPQAACWFVDLL